MHRKRWMLQAITAMPHGCLAGLAIVKAKQERKEKEKENFYRCKLKCICKSEKCDALKLRECPSCHDILRSVCSKARCKTDDGKRPVMILPNAASKTARKNLRFDEDFSDGGSESDTSLDVGTSDDDEDQDDDQGNNDDDDPIASAQAKLISTWKSLSPPVKESEIINQWYGVAYKGKRREILHVAKVLRRFLYDEDGPVESLLMSCLKPKVGSGNILDEPPKHLPDNWEFNLNDVILGPLEVSPHHATQFVVKDYDDLVQHFNTVIKLNRENIDF